MTSHVWTFCFSWRGSHTCKFSPRSVQPLQRKGFLKVKNKQTCLLNNVTDDVIKFYSCGPIYPKMTQNIFVFIGCGIIHMQLWCHNEGTYDVIINNTHSAWGVLAMFQVLIFSLVRFQRCRGPIFFRFSNMAATPRDIWHHYYLYNMRHE